MLEAADIIDELSAKLWEANTPAERIPAEAFSPAEYLADELVARGWSAWELVKHMPGDPAAHLSHALGSSAEMWRNLAQTQRQHDARGET